MKRYLKVSILLFVIGLLWNIYLIPVYAKNDDVNYEKDYLTKMFNSENGLEGTASNCIYAASDGFLWIGGYAGLYRYDGTEFRRVLMMERALPVNVITQDQNDNFWIGTNGDGLYRYDGNKFVEYPLDETENGAYIINKLHLDSEGILWIGTKAGLYSIDTKQNKSAIKSNEMLSGMVIQDICEIKTGETIVIEKTGKVFLIYEGKTKELVLSQKNESWIPRCCSAGTEDYFYLGTTGEQLLKITKQGDVLTVIEGNGLSSFNDIMALDKGTFWICSDSGIGILKDGRITKIQSPLNDSVENVCVDYQGNLWFASSRQGVMQMYKNYFSDLGSYWGLDQTVNAIQLYQNKIYVGCDNGLYCFQDKIQLEDELVKQCKGERIRQIYLDQEERLWVTTYQSGIKVLYPNGEITSLNKKNCNLQTDQIRCVWQRNSGDVLIGTEEGLFLLGHNCQVQPFVEDDILCSKRILDVKEDKAGTVYVSTDGYGVYIIKNRRVECVYSKQQGLLSSVILKVVPSEQMQGIWIITGEEICFLDQKGILTRVTGIPVANSLDFLFTEDGDAIILAGNGFFRLKEETLLDSNEVSYTHFNKQDGLPIDFTANAYHTIEDGILYMCGTTGVASIDLNGKRIERPIRLYLNQVTEDGKEIILHDGQVVVSPTTHRLNIDVRLINFVHQNIYRGYYLKNLDEQQTIIQGNGGTEVSYTNLDGGSYLYEYKVYEKESETCIAKLSIPIVKKYMIWEEPLIKVLLILVALMLLILSVVLIIRFKEKQMAKKLKLQFLKEKEEEIAKLAYRDLVTGAYNRNCFEQERKKVDVQEIYAMFCVSINHMEYMKKRYGIRYVEAVLRKAVEIIQKCSEETMVIYRVSDNVFLFWMTEPVQLESCIQNMKEQFQQSEEEKNVPLSLAVGAIYNNHIEKETINELIDRCDKLRLLDEKHAEAKFVEGKMKFL